MSGAALLAISIVAILSAGLPYSLILKYGIFLFRSVPIVILVIGLLVDDGIVIAENIYQHFERGKPVLEAAIDGTLEVLPARTEEPSVFC